MLGAILTACSKEPADESQRDRDRETSDKKNPKDEDTSNEPSEDSAKPGKDDKETSGGYQTLAEKTGFGYLASYQPIEGGFQYAYGLQALANGRMMMRAETYDEETGYQMVYLTMNPDGSDIQELPMPAFNENEYMQSMCPTEDGFWAVTYEWVSSGTVSGGDMVVYDVPVAEVAVAAGTVIGGVDGPVAVAVAEPDTLEEPAVTDEPAGTDSGSDDDWMNSTAGDDDDWTGTDDDWTGTEEETPPVDDDIWIDTDEDIMPEEPEYFESYEIYRLYKVDLQGNIVAQPDITSLSEGMDYFYISNMFADQEGQLYLVCETTLFRLDETGKVTGKLEVTNWIETAFMLPDGRMIVSYYGETGREMCWLDTETMELGEAVSFDDSDTWYSFYSGGGSYDLYLDDQNVLYGYDMDSGEMTPLLNWMDSDVDTYSMNGFCVVSEEEIVFLYSEDYESGVELGTLRRVPFEEIPARTTITIGGNYLNYDFRRIISKFNRTNETYRVSFLDYSDYATEEDYMASYDRLDMDMASGGGPDILMLDSNVNVENYIAKGLLTDLYTFMGEGAQWQKEDLLQGFRNAKEIDGGLYELTANFSFTGLWTNAKIVGEDGVLSLDELLAACEQLDEDGCIMPYYTKEDALYTILATSYDDLIDPVTGECHFDTPEFAKLLQYANYFPAEIDWENDNYAYSSTGMMLRSGQQIFTDFHFYSFDDLTYQLVENGGLDGEVVCVGYPSVSGSKFLLNENSALAINANSQYQDACWELVSALLSDEYQEQNSWQISVRVDKVQEQAARAMEPPYYIDENGEKVEYENTYWVNGEEVKVEPLTQEQVDYFMNLINSVDGSYHYDQELVTVVSEEAAAFFAGQKSAEEVSRLIQSRVQIYINEQR